MLPMTCRSHKGFSPTLYDLSGQNVANDVTQSQGLLSNLLFTPVRKLLTFPVGTPGQFSILHQDKEDLGVNPVPLASLHPTHLLLAAFTH
jgi:hypothetical protein